MRSMKEFIDGGYDGGDYTQGLAVVFDSEKEYVEFTLRLHKEYPQVDLCTLYEPMREGGGYVFNKCFGVLYANDINLKFMKLVVPAAEFLYPQINMGAVLDFVTGGCNDAV